MHKITKVHFPFLLSLNGTRNRQIVKVLISGYLLLSRNLCCFQIFPMGFQWGCRGGIQEKSVTREKTKSKQWEHIQLYTDCNNLYLYMLASTILSYENYTQSFFKKERNKQYGNGFFQMLSEFSLNGQERCVSCGDS